MCWRLGQTEKDFFKMHILTFDIEDWFHLLDVKATKTEADWEKYPSRIHENMETIFSICQSTGQKATFFCLGWVARKYPEIIRKIVDAGFEIATHSDLHQLAYEQNRNEFKSDLERSIKSLEDVSGQKIRAYRAPGFSLMQQNKWVFEELIKHGIEIDCSVFPAQRGHGGFEEFGHAEPCWINIDGHKIKEFPINLQYVLGKPMIFSGGGYFRFLPLPVLKWMFKKSDYVMTYFHPRDFDPNQPSIEELNAIRRFKSYYGLAACESKLKSILQQQTFIDLATANASVDWTKAKTIQL
jgi:peptidoglycan-N-acetylglucosamine deacetylase